MRIIIVALLLIVLGGCREESYSDPYIAAVDKYIASLDSANAAGKQVDPPPKPVYLKCPVQPQPYPSITGAGITRDTVRNTSRMGGLATRSQAQCEQTNTARKRAYEEAMKKYRRVITSEGVD